MNARMLSLVTERLERRRVASGLALILVVAALAAAGCGRSEGYGAKAPVIEPRNRIGSSSSWIRSTIGPPAYGTASSVA